MARDGKKYAALNAAQKLAGGTGAAGSPLANYLEFKAGRRKLNQRKTARLPAALLSRLKVRLLPFDQSAEAIGGTGTARVSHSGYITVSSDAFRKKTSPTGAPPGTVYPNGGAALTNADLGYIPEGPIFRENGSFYSALLRCNYQTGAVTNRPNSGVTGRDYKSKASTIGATIPFGRTATAFVTDTQQKRFEVLSEKLKAGKPADASMSVSLAPEEFVDGQKDNGFAEDAAAPGP